MVFCVVCSCSTSPMLILNEEEMKTYEAMVAPFINLELLIKTHTILVCQGCKGQIHMVQNFQAAAVAGAQHLQSFLLGQQVEEEETQHDFEMELSEEDTKEMKLKIVAVEEPGMPGLAVESTPQALSEPLAGDIKMKDESSPTSPSESDPAAAKHEAAKLATGNAGDAATPGPSGTQCTTLQTSASTASGISKSNMYDPKFLNKYFSEALSQTNKPEPGNVAGNSISGVSPRANGAAGGAAGGTGADTDKFIKPPVSSETRRRIVALDAAGLSVTEIANELGITRNTVMLWLKRWRAEGHVSSRASPGRPRCTSRSQDSNILKTVQRQQGFLSTALFAKDLGINHRTKKIVKCAACAATFMNARYLAAHCRARHQPKVPKMAAGAGADGKQPRKKKPVPRSMPVLTDQT